VVTAGPTQEPIDPVRYLSNRSSGRMGYAIAGAALEAGHSVVLISGRVNLVPPASARLIPVQTSDEMYEAVHRQLAECDVLVMCAAVADYKPALASPQKIKKTNRPVSLELIPTRDILGSLPQSRSFFVVGFAAETSDLEKNARKKLVEKHCDMIVANDVSGRATGMESADNEVTIFLHDDEEPIKLLRAPKEKIARELIKIISNAKKKV